MVQQGHVLAAYVHACLVPVCVQGSHAEHNQGPVEAGLAGLHWEYFVHDFPASGSEFSGECPNET